MKTFKYKRAINYSGYRDGQSPRDNMYPSQEEILEDLLLLKGKFYYLRIYDCSPHAYNTLKVITKHKLPFKVLIGLSLLPEENHVNHPYFPQYDDAILQKNKIQNEYLIEEIIDVANTYKKIVSAISVGNETRSEWNNHRISIDTLIKATKMIQNQTGLPVTFCEEYHNWIKELAPLAKVVDFISLHTYPAWQGASIDGALDMAVAHFNEVQQTYPNTYCIITETGWPTSSHGSRIKSENCSIENQKIYNKAIEQWGKKNNTLVYLFEAFDESWKGGINPLEPEKNWGVYYSNRTPK